MITPFFYLVRGGKVDRPGGVGPELGKWFKVMPYAKKKQEKMTRVVSLAYWPALEMFKLNQLPQTDLAHTWCVLL